jgi:DNA-binding MltR family transcriptional regulator
MEDNSELHENQPFEKGFDLKESFEVNAKEWKLALESHESDRAISIIAVCVIDDLVKKLLKAVFIKNRKVDSLFNNEHILQTTFAKINLAYYLGLIPSVWYEDLLRLNRVRNVFAHSLTGKLSFDSEQIYKLLTKLKLGPRNLGEDRMAKWRFIITAQQAIDFLLIALHFYEKYRMNRVSEVLNFEKWNWQTGLTKDQLKEIGEKDKKYWYRITSGNLEYYQGEDVICVDPNAKLSDSNLVVCNISNQEHFGTIKKIENETFVSVNGENIKLNDCEIVGKITTKITQYK